MKKDPSGYYADMMHMVVKGDLPGHPFRGNQYREGQSGERNEPRGMDKRQALNHLSRVVGTKVGKMNIQSHEGPGRTGERHEIRAAVYHTDTFNDKARFDNMIASLKGSGYEQVSHGYDERTGSGYSHHDNRLTGSSIDLRHSAGGSRGATFMRGVPPYTEISASLHKRSEVKLRPSRPEVR